MTVLLTDEEFALIQLPTGGSAAPPAPTNGRSRRLTDEEFSQLQPVPPEYEWALPTLSTDVSELATQNAAPVGYGEPPAVEGRAPRHTDEVAQEFRPLSWGKGGEFGTGGGGAGWDAPPTTVEKAANVASSFIRGFSRMATSIPKSVALAATGLDKLITGKADKDAKELATWKLGAAIDDWVDKTFTGHPELRESLWLEQLPTGFGSMTAFLVGGLASGPSVVGKAYGIPAMMGASNQSVASYERALARGDPERAMGAAGLGGLMGPFEAFPVGGILGRWNKASGGTLLRKLRSIFVSGGIGALEEGTQEGVSGVGENVIAMTTGEKTSPFAGVKEQATVGGIVGGVMAAIVGGAGSMRESQRRALIEPLMDQRVVESAKKNFGIPTKEVYEAVTGEKDASRKRRREYVRKAEEDATKQMEEAIKVLGELGQNQRVPESTEIIEPETEQEVPRAEEVGEGPAAPGVAQGAEGQAGGQVRVRGAAKGGVEAEAGEGVAKPVPDKPPPVIGKQSWMMTKRQFLDISIGKKLNPDSAAFRALSSKEQARLLADQQLRDMKNRTLDEASTEAERRARERESSREKTRAIIDQFRKEITPEWAHRSAVESAISRGEKVPHVVLADYPDLRTRAAEGAGKPRLPRTAKAKQSPAAPLPEGQAIAGAATTPAVGQPVRWYNAVGEVREGFIKEAPAAEGGEWTVSTAKGQLFALKPSQFEVLTEAPSPSVTAEPEQATMGGEASEQDRLIGVEDVPATPEATGAKISEHAIVAGMERNFGVKMRSGRIPKKSAARYKPFEEIIRAQGQFVGHLGVATHELAHHIDKTQRVRHRLPKKARAELKALDYDTEKKRSSEGFAEYMRILLTDDTAPSIAPEFHRWFMEDWLPAHDAIRVKLEELRVLIDQWRQQGARAYAAANMSRTGKVPRPAGVSMLSWTAEKASDMVHRAYAAMKDEAHYLKLAERAARERGYSPDPGNSPYDMVMAFSGAGPTQAAHAIDDGVFFVGPDKFGKKISKGFKEIFANLHPNERDEWTIWAWARHAREAWSKGINPGLPKALADWLYERHRGNERFERIAQDFTDFNNALINMLVDAGVISANSGEKMKAFWITYLPLHRVVDVRKSGLGAKRFTDLPPAVRARVGSGYPIIDPIQSTVERAVRFYTRAHQEQVIRAMIHMAETTEGMGQWIERIPPKMKPTRVPVEQIKQQLKAAGVDEELFTEFIEQSGIDPDDALTIFKPDYRSDDKRSIVRLSSTFDRASQSWTAESPSLYQIHPDLYRAISGMNQQQYSFFLRLFGMATRLTKLGATTLNPDFMLRNIARDHLTYLIQRESKAGVFDPEKMLAAYVYTTAAHAMGKKGDPIVGLFQQMGGELSTILGLDTKIIEQKIRQVMGSTNERALHQIIDPRNWVDAVRTLVTSTEVASRLAQFEASMKADGWSRSRIAKEGMPPRHVLVRAINDAHEVTVNFKRMGSLGRKINQVIPFFNAGLEGLDRFARFWRDHPRRAMVWTAAGVAATISYWLMRKDDDDYKEQADWLKYGYWTITDEKGAPVARIPIPFEWGILVKGGTEAILNTWNDFDPKAVKAWAQEAAKSISPLGYPSLVTPFIEAKFNYDLFRNRPIYPSEKMRHRLPAEQYTAYNTDTMKAIGGWLGISPAKLEHIVNGTTGGLYRNLAVPTERLASEGQPIEPREVWPISAFSLRTDYTKSPDEFYDRLAAVQQERGSLQAKGEMVSEGLEREHDRLSSLSGLMGDIRQLVPDVRNRNERFKYERYLVGLGRFALRRPELDRYPNPLTDSGAPDDLRILRDEWLAGRLIEVGSTSKTGESAQRRARSLSIIRDLEMNTEQVRRTLLAEHARRRKDDKKGNEWTGTYTRRTINIALRELGLQRQEQ